VLPLVKAQAVIKVTKTRFKEHFLPAILELVADEEGEVQIEGIVMLADFMKVVKKDSVQNDFIPHLDKLMTSVQDPAYMNDVRVKLSEIQGRIVE
jgi:hypothetical protein